MTKLDQKIGCIILAAILLLTMFMPTFSLAITQAEIDDMIEKGNEYQKVNFADYNAYLGEKGYLPYYIKTYTESLERLFTFKSNQEDIVLMSEDGHFETKKEGEATITATAKADENFTKTFKMKVAKIAENQTLGTKVEATFIDNETILKANGDLLKIYASDEKAEKIASNIKKCVYDVVYDNQSETYFHYGLFLKKDGTVEYEFNGVKSALKDGKDIGPEGYLRKDGTYVKMQSDGTWQEEIENVVKIVGNYFVKKDGKTYDVNDNKVCDFPIKEARGDYIVDNANVLWIIDYGTATEVDKNFASFVTDSIYKDKMGILKYSHTGVNAEHLQNKYDDVIGEIKIATDGKCYLNDQLILTGVVSNESLIERNIYDNTQKSRQVFLREDGSIWVLYFNGEGKLLKLKETENIFLKKDTLTLRKFNEDTPVISGFNMKELTVEKAFTSLQKGYTVKVFKKDKQLKTSDKLYTGARVQIYNSKGIKINEYTALVYGDVTGTGNPSAKDALMIIKNKLGEGAKLEGLNLEAARVTEATRKKGATPTSADALAIVRAKLGKYTIK